MLYHETKARKKGFEIIVGVDEAGRGPLAGPVVASAVALKTTRFRNQIKDSKSISQRKREKAFNEILKKSYVGIGIVNESIIDSLNILKATYCAMSQAIAQLIEKLPQERKKKRNFKSKVCILVDGNSFKTDMPYFYRTVVRGDQTSKSIACASIVAKVTRDRILHVYDKIYPEYGFKSHKGYPTKTHKEAIKRYGPSRIQRKTFKLT